MRRSDEVANKLKGEKMKGLETEKLQKVAAKVLRTVGFLAIVSTFVACGSNSDDAKKAAPNNPPPAQAKDVTDRSTCFGEPRPGINIFSSWMADYETSSIQFHQILKVEDLGYQRARVTALAICEVAGMQATASVVSMANVTPDRLEILNSDSRTEERQWGDNKLTCTANIQRAVLNYNFRGDCLRFYQGSEEMVLPRADRPY